MSPIFSYFDYRTRPQTADSDSVIPLIRFQLEEYDQESGRFWIGLLHAFRAIFPGIGQHVLESIIDHHHQPLPKSISQFANELQQKEWGLILENTHHIGSTNWWPGFKEWLLRLEENHSIELQEDPTDPGEKETEELLQNLSPELRIALAVSEVWWKGWFLKEFPGENWSEIWVKLRVANYIHDFSPEIILPKESIFHNLRYQLKEEDVPLLNQQQSRLADWLEGCGEWLEAVRIRLINKDFENAGDLLEKHGQNWLDEGANPLEVLFWLKEIPGVLMTSRPGLCLLTAQAAYKLQLSMQTSYYLNALENHLLSLRRFSKSEAQWHTMELDEKSTTIQSMLEKIQQMRSGEK
jgi:hypothetical protein